MRQLWKKEWQLALHPTCLVFLLLACMVLIPSYPYYVVFFYTGLGVFFTCLSGRENQDVFYTMLLPVSRRQLVGARMGTAVGLELVQLVLVGLLSLLRRRLGLPDNAAGMEANLALLGLSLLMLGLFHVAFFGYYYGGVHRVGRALLLGGGVELVYIAVVEAMTFTVPLFRDRLDTQDPAFLGEKLLVLGVGLVGYGLLTCLAYHISCKRFEALDL
jgi:hypothetical protein